MGILDALYGNGDPDKVAAMGLLGAQMMGGNTAGGLQGAMGLLAQAPDRALKRQLEQMQVENMRSEIAQRAAAMERQNRLLEMGQRLVGGGGPVQAMPGQLGSGSFGAVSPPAGQPDIGPARRPGGFENANFNDVMAFHLAGGPDLTNSYKFAREGIERKPGSFYEDLQGRRQYIGDPTKGITMGQDGSVQMMPNADVVLGRLAGATANAQEEAKAKNDLVQVYNNDTKQMDFVPRSVVLGRNQPPAAPSYGGPAAPPRAQPVAPRPGNPMASRPEDSDRPMIYGQELQKAQDQLLNPGKYMTQADLALDPDMSKFRQRAQANIDGIQREIKAAGIQLPAQPKTMSAGPSASDKTSLKFGEELAGKQAEILDKSNTAAQAAAQDIASIQQSRKALQGGAFVGSGAETKLAVAKFINANIPGITVDPEKVANTDYLKSTLGRGLLEQAKTLGSNPSNADANRINDIVGSIGKDPGALSKILDWRQEMAQRAITLHNGRVDQAEASGYKAPFDLRVKSPLDQPSRQVVDTLPKTAQRGARARDTTTGETLVFNGMSWVKEK